MEMAFLRDNAIVTETCSMSAETAEVQARWAAQTLLRATTMHLLVAMTGAVRWRMSAGCAVERASQKGLAIVKEMCWMSAECVAAMDLPQARAIAMETFLAAPIQRQRTTTRMLAKTTELVSSWDAPVQVW